jgi:hypothetical protein
LLTGRVFLLALALAALVVTASANARAPVLGRETAVGLAIADFDLDGRLDVATSNVAGSVSVLRGRGDGTLARGVLHRADGTHEQAAAGDFNEDGAPDLVTGDDGKGISVLLNDGSGKLSDPVAYRTGKGQIGAVALGDLNVDGHLDVVAADFFGTHGLFVFLGRGDGTLAPYHQYRAPGGSASVAVGDVDQDGALDVVATTFNATRSGVLLLRGLGDGRLAPPVMVAELAVPADVELVDINRDRALDVISSGFGLDAGVAVSLGRGDGSFETANAVATGPTYSLAVSDFNGDALPDLALSIFLSRRVGVYLGDGSGSFTAGGIFRAGRRVNDIDTADLDGDSNADLLLALSDQGTVQVFRGIGDGTFAASVSAATGPEICNVPDVRGLRVPAARRALAASHCRLGTIRSAPSRRFLRGRVLSTRPRDGARLQLGARVHLIVGSGHAA